MYKSYKWTNRKTENIYLQYVCTFFSFSLSLIMITIKGIYQMTNDYIIVEVISYLVDIRFSVDQSNTFIFDHLNKIKFLFIFILLLLLIIWNLSNRKGQNTFKCVQIWFGSFIHSFIWIRVKQFYQQRKKMKLKFLNNWMNVSI